MFLALAVLLTAQCAQSGDDVATAAAAYAAAQQRVKSGETKLGVAQLRALLTTSPWFIQARWALAHAEIGRGAYVVGYVEMKRFLSETTEEEDRVDARKSLRALETKIAHLGLYADAERAASAQRWSEVQIMMEKLVEERPNFALAYRLLGIAHTHQHHYPAAVTAFSEYLGTDPMAAERAEIEERLSEYQGTR